MFESLKSDAQKTFDIKTAIEKDLVIKRSANLVKLIEERYSFFNSSHQVVKCEPNSEMIIVQLEDIKFNQLLAMTRTFKLTINYFSSIFPKCENVSMKLRCKKLIVSFFKKLLFETN